MNTKTLALFLLVTSLSGCVVNRNGSYSGNVQFTWTLGGLTCSNVPQVTSIAINIPGEVLQNNGVFPCLTNNYPGIVLHDFLPGTYSFTIQALNASGTVLYAAAGNFTVNGDVLVSVDLSPTSAATASAYLTWSFPPNSQSSNPTCAQAGVDVMDVTIDQVTQRYNCSDGQVQPGVVVGPLNPGTHSIALAASSQSVGYPYYRLTSALQTTAGTPVSAAYGLQWAVGGVSVQWQINGSDCSNIPSVYVNFQDGSGRLVYPGSGDRQNCSDGLAPSGALRYDYLPAGNYSLILLGPAIVGGTLTNSPYPPVAITAGVFSDSRTIGSVLHP
jgi:hypothetical protein